MPTTLEIIRGISQAAANAYDGAHDEKYSYDGQSRKTGLKREEGDPILDKRVIDGFKVKFHGPLLRVSYHSEVRLKEVHENGFESEIEQMIQDVANFLKKEYKAVTGNSLQLTAEGDPKILIQRVSNVRSDCNAYRDYRIGKLKDVEDSPGTSEERLDKAISKFLSLGRDKAPKPRNITRKD